MIKQSFLRNYSLSKIYHQAEDEKNKLKVYYLRKVRKILKDKHQQDRATQREKLSHDNKQERLKRRLFQKVKTECCDSDSLTHPLPYGRSGTSAGIRDLTVSKPELNFIEVKFEDGCDEGSESVLRNEKLKALRVKLSNSILHSNKLGNEDTFDKVRGFLRKNTVNRTLLQQRGAQMRQGSCNNHSIVFSCQQTVKQGQSQCGPRRGQN